MKAFLIGNRPVNSEESLEFIIFSGYAPLPLSSVEHGLVPRFISAFKGAPGSKFKLI